MSKGRVVVALSGGVDSSVAALLLKEAGYEVIGVTMRLWTMHNPEAAPLSRRCCSVEDVEDARRVCQIIGAPHYYLNFEQEFKTHVIDYFISEYRGGRTPYPCLACNDHLKFSFLLQRAMFHDAQYIATGHYARIDSADSRYRLLKSIDANKDQSYVLFGLTQEQLAHTLLPIGCLDKGEIRSIARGAGLPVADKPDSQEICFIPDGDYRGFLVGQGAESHAGEIVDSQGTLLGHHQGIEGFTIGQRKGLGFSSPRPMYVKSLDPQANRVVVSYEDELFNSSLYVQEVRWISGRPLDGPIRVTAKIRYKSVEAPATVVPNGHGVLVRFDSPQRAITPGQPAVFYDGEEVLGGGIILSIGVSEVAVNQNAQHHPA